MGFYEDERIRHKNLKWNPIIKNEDVAEVVVENDDSDIETSTDEENK